jgi:hypothetical protein
MLSLLNKKLKDDIIMELLESHEVEVIYEFDRTHENLPDVYWAGIKQAGVQLRFNDYQILDTIFCYIKTRDGFEPIVPDDIGVPIFSSFDEAEQNCKKRGVKYKIPPSSQTWLKVEDSVGDVHYEFQDGLLAMVTLMRSTAGA